MLIGDILINQYSNEYVLAGMIFSTRDKVSKDYNAHVKLSFLIVKIGTDEAALSSTQKFWIRPSFGQDNIR